MSDMRVTGCRCGWEKYAGPVLGSRYGTCFDVSVLKADDMFKMYFSWRPEKSIAYVESPDGIHWSEPIICLKPRTSVKGWEDDVNRPCVLKKDDRYHMWYTGQYKAGEADGTSHVFYATSVDGVHFERVSTEPVMTAEAPWEKVAVMNPDVMWDEDANRFKMWYSAGEQYEPNAIGYAESEDGIHWEKYAGNPIFQANPQNTWERHKAAGCHVVKSDYYYMFYIGYFNEDYAQIGVARSENGINNWERHSQNPMIAPQPGNWDGEACYKPYPVFDGEKWMLWYNGRVGTLEQIGLAIHEGYDLGFDNSGQE